MIPADIYAATTLQQQIDEAAEGSTIEVTGDYTEDIHISKDITLVGDENSTISGTWEISGGAAVTLEGLQLTADTDGYLLVISDKGNAVTLKDMALDNEGNGVLIDDTALSTSLTLDHTSLTSKRDEGRALGIRGAGSDVNIKNGSVLNTTGRQQAATLHINVLDLANSATVNIEESSILSDNYYAFFSWGGTITANITDSKLSGYAAIYLKEDSINTIQIEGSEIIGSTKYEGSSDNFGAIVLEGSDNQIIASGDTTITNEFLEGATSEEQLILFSSAGNAAENLIQLEDVIMKNTDDTAVAEFVGYNSNENEITITTETSFTDETGEPVPITREADGAFENAYSSFDDALAKAQKNDLVMELLPGTYERENGQIITIKETEYLAFSEAVKEAAKATFPSIALAKISGDELIITANKISLLDDNLTLRVKQSKQLEVVFDPIDTTIQEVTWMIADEAIAKVSDSGVLTGVSAGDTTLTITTADGLSTEYDVTVTQSCVWIPIIIVIGILLFLVCLVKFIIWIIRCICCC